MINYKKRIADYTAADAFKIFTSYMVGYLFLSIILNYVLPTDDTDEGRLARSGVRIVTDHATGVQYLETPQGFLTPRLGKQ